MAMDDEPARAFRHVTPCREHKESEKRADAESHTPADIHGEDVGIEQDQGCPRTKRRADPETAVDGKRNLSSHARRNQLVNRRIDRGIFAAYANAGYCAAHGKTKEIPGERAHQRAAQVDA